MLNVYVGNSIKGSKEPPQNGNPSEVSQWITHLQNLLVELAAESQSIWDATASVRYDGPTEAPKENTEIGRTTPSELCTISHCLSTIAGRIENSINRIRSTRTDLRI